MATCQEAEEYILSIPRFAGKHSLADTGRLLERLGCGEIKGKVIHVAGTNGKGSVCAYLRSILLESGCPVGMFISPHLETMRERISLGMEIISEQEFAETFERVRDALREDERAGGSHPSFFEFLFLMAMVYFRERQPDYLVLETGLGGRLDATNSLTGKALSVITEIGYDHMQYLGNTLEEIAAEKAGIIEPGTPVVFVDRRPECTKVLSDHAQKAKSPAIIIGKNSISDVNIKNKTIDFSLYTGYYRYVNLSLSTCAPWQTENASLAVAAAESLKDERISAASIREGLRKAFWPGRMEEIRPGIYLDGAHNEDGMEAFLSAVGSGQCQGRRLLLFGVLADKRYEEMAEQIMRSGLFEEIAVTVPDSERSLSLEREREVWKRCMEREGVVSEDSFGIRMSFHESAMAAYRKLLMDKTDQDVIYITGSLYLIGQMRSFLRKTD